jgi:hypothetical protein
VARQSNGTYIQPANTAAVSGQAISSTAFNTLIADVGAEITNSLDRGGRSAMTAPLPMGGQKITGMADPTNPTDGANKNYVDGAANFTTGDVKLTFKTVPDSGWLMLDDTSFGSAASAAAYKSAAAQALFIVLYNLSDANAPLYTAAPATLTTRAAQGTAATAWAANCAMSLPKQLGRALGVAGSGAGITARGLGQAFGEETHTLTLGELPTGITSTNPAPFTSTVTPIVGGGNIIPLSSASWTQNSNIATTGTATIGGITGGSVGYGNLITTAPGAANVTSNNTSAAGHNNIPPTLYYNAMIKL